MKDIEIVIFNDKSWVRLTEYQKNEEQLTKRIYELQSDLSKAKSQIEKMKCCGNCKFWRDNGYGIFCKVTDGKHMRKDKCDNKWELAE